MSDQSGVSLFRRVRWIVYVCWVVAAIRLMLDFREEEPGVFLEFGHIAWQAVIGVYYAIPVLLLIAAIRGTFRGLGFKKNLFAPVLLGALCIGVPNVVSYTTGQFMGWTHGRFRPPVAESTVETEDQDLESRQRSGPVYGSAVEKVGAGLVIGAVTVIPGTLWTLVWMIPFVYLPALLRGRT